MSPMEEEKASIRMLICGLFNSDLIPLSRAYTKLFYIERRSFYSPHDFIIIAHYYILFSFLAFLLHCSLKSIDIWLLPASNVFLSLSLLLLKIWQRIFSCTTMMMKWEYKSVFFLLLLESCKRFFLPPFSCCFSFFMDCAFYVMMGGRMRCIKMVKRVRDKSLRKWNLSKEDT